MTESIWRIENIEGYPFDVHIYSTLTEYRRKTNQRGALAGTHLPTDTSGHISVHLPIKSTLGTVAHEAVHIAQALRRRGCTEWSEQAEDDEEEVLAYPVGDITEWVWTCLVNQREKTNKAKSSKNS